MYERWRSEGCVACIFFINMFFDKVTQKLIKRSEKCMGAAGEYVEEEKYFEPLFFICEYKNVPSYIQLVLSFVCLPQAIIKTWETKIEQGVQCIDIIN